MKKSRVSKLPEPRPLATSSDRKLRRQTEKSKITAKRVTLLPGFLTAGVKSETVHRSTNTIDQPSGYDDDVLKENLHGLLREDKPLSKRTSNTVLPASAYYLHVATSTPTLNQSKSIFREIKQKYVEKIEREVNHDFKARLFGRLGSNFVPKDGDTCKRDILDEVLIVNDIIAGKVDPDDMSINRKRPYNDEDKENYPLKLSYIPPTKWVFQTPPNRKLNYSHAKVEESCMKPAILENRNEGKIVYEVNNKINVDFSRYSNRQEIDIDKRYMVEVASMQGNNEDFTFQFPDQEDVVEKKFQLQTDTYELENHFLSLTCRPKKAPCTVSRVAGLKRKRDIFEPEAAGCSTELETVNEFDSSFTIINNLSSLEESFTFKFTANDGATTGHIFDFDGNKKDTFNFHY